jgi:hypothetical protein
MIVQVAQKLFIDGRRGVRQAAERRLTTGSIMKRNIRSCNNFYLRERDLKLFLYHIVLVCVVIWNKRVSSVL